MSEEEEKSYPQAVLKTTRSGKGLLIIIPDPVTNSSHTYITSLEYVRYLLDGKLRNNILGCNYVSDGRFEQFLDKIWRKKNVNILDIKGKDPFSAKAQSERKKLELKNVDEW